jgi:hypothetical protein
MGTTISRQALSEHNLVQLLNWELAAFDKCSGTRFITVSSMAKPDHSGCNWREAQLQADHPLDLTERGIVRRVIALTRREFNVS